MNGFVGQVTLKSKEEALSFVALAKKESAVSPSTSSGLIASRGEIYSKDQESRASKLIEKLA